MAPSTSTPIEIAIPDSDIRFAFSPIRYMGMKASITLIGMVRMGTMAEGMCQRKSRMMMDTTIISSISLSVTVLMARPMRSERS